MHLGPRARLIAITSAVLVIVGALSIGGVLAFGPLFPAANAQPTVDLVSKKTVARSLTSPWGLAFLPDGSALVSERDTGLVRRIAGRSNGSPARSLTKTSTVGTVSGVRAGGEGGLLGIAVPPTPRGTQPEVIFAYLTTARDNRVVRIAWDGRSLGRQTPIVTGIPKNTYHNGGRILVDDDVLYIATGDAGIPELAQDRTSLAGKVLRVDFDGAPAAGNPIDGSRIFTLGHRNVQGLALDDAGRLWATEFGTSKADELNLLRPGRNYGWPVVEGRSSKRGFTNPKVTWSPTSTASPSGLAIQDGAAYVASLRGEVLWRVPLKGTRAGKPRAVDLGEQSRLRTVAAAPDGRLWLSTSNTDGRGDPGSRDDRMLSLIVDD
ncbi:MAG: PQQ-dependent sugar dehydrogenase [Candidatus Nanopelagicales bacterium]|nr:PQQ-dependent sugar dehydrogenase [Actinomycetota bacterium]NDH14709.1 PQQ-dependent sugar dehydrogenase [Actinomycetota bacterium]NDH18846.1 PQQ-dependent sugar dehydrogenase [Actinomycetota bacterium]